MSDAVPSDLSAPPAAPAPAQRTILRRAEKVPLPRRLVAAALIFGVLAIVLNALPRPYKPVDTFFVLTDLGHAYADSRAAVASVDGQEEIAGQAPAKERGAYRRELWVHEWIGITRELALRVSVWLCGVSLLGAVGLIARRAREERRALEAKGARLAPQLLRTEVIEERAAPIVAPALPAPLLPAEPPPSIVVEPRGSLESPETTREEKPVAETPAPAIDPALAKLGFQPRPKADDEPDEEDDDGRPRPRNLARSSGDAPAAKEVTETRTSPAAPLPATTAELAFPIGFPATGPSRPVVKPGTSKAPEDPEHTVLSADRDSVEKTVTNPDAEKTVENPGNTVTDEKSPGDKKPE
ncbi:MAG TPA: hypothetical protein VMV18_07900 [bacterium]|nr:hypothetical protein [bacterium]